MQKATNRLTKQAPVVTTVLLSCSPDTYTHYATQDGVHAMFHGEVSGWPGIDMMSAQHDGGCWQLLSGRIGRCTENGTITLTPPCSTAAFVRGEPESGDNDAAWLLRFYETFKVTVCSLISLASSCLAPTSFCRRTI